MIYYLVSIVNKEIVHLQIKESDVMFKNWNAGYIVVIFSIVILYISSMAFAGDSNNPIEAGSVSWGRDFDEALRTSKKTGMPVLVLFQEIPGCSGCRTFGSEVLTSPLLVEAIESEFLPVLVYNNRPGTRDQQLLEKFWEPGWNYQVIRFLNGNGDDIIPRKDRIWTIGGVASRMVMVLEKTGRPVPNYLRALVLENDSVHHGMVGFAMACFWTGEYKLGRIDGVITTEAGWFDNREVTLVTYHKKLLPLHSLVSLAVKERCAQRIYLMPGDTVEKSRFTIKPLLLKKYKTADSSDQKKQLENWPEIRLVENLSPMQVTKINAFAPDNREKGLSWLSPRQLKVVLTAQ